MFQRTTPSMGRRPNPIPNTRRIFTLTPEDAAKLVELRDRYELTSDAAVIRKLIREAHKRE